MPSELEYRERPWNNGPWEWDSGVGRVEIYGAVTVPNCPVPLRSHPICIVDTRDGEGNAQLVALSPEMAEAILAWDNDPGGSGGCEPLSVLAEKLRSFG